MFLHAAGFGIVAAAVMAQAALGFTGQSGVGGQVGEAAQDRCPELLVQMRVVTAVFQAALSVLWYIGRIGLTQDYI